MSDARRGWGVGLLVASATAIALARIVAGAPEAELDFHAEPTTRLLVLAPHPDDETLGAAGLIQRVNAAGGSVYVVMMTSGDAFPEGVAAEAHIRRPKPRDYRNYGNLRERESTAALQSLGVDRAHQLFLGFPDGGLCLIASKYFSAKRRAFESPFTNRYEPSASERVIRGVTYRGADIRREVESVLLTYRPTVIALPTPEDDHPDHCATALFVREALEVLGLWHEEFAPRILQYIVHADEWPNLNEDLETPLQPPHVTPAAGDWRTLPLTRAETVAKRRALEDYPSQMLVIGRFLRAFGRPNELFLEGGAALQPECWCDETNVATEAPPENYRRPRGRR